jgi:hypothetical protein
MSRIYKYHLEVYPRQVLMMPEGAKVISVGTQGEIAHDNLPNSQMPVLFALIPDPNARAKPRIFRTVTTGEVFNEEGLEFIGTTFIDWYTAHVFEVIGKNPDPIEERFQDDMREISGRGMVVNGKPRFVPPGLVR